MQYLFPPESPPQLFWYVGFNLDVLQMFGELGHLSIFKSSEYVSKALWLQACLWDG